MLQNLLIAMMLMTIIIFTQLKHPLTMGLTLLIQTILVSVSLSLMSETYWFSYILFLIFIGGMLILFIYVTSLASNEIFDMSNKNFIMLLIMNMLFMTILLFYEKIIINEFFLSNSLNFINENFMNLIKLFNYPTNLITILLMNYLLMVLIAIVKITNIFYGPLRQMYN